MLVCLISRHPLCREEKYEYKVDNLNKSTNSANYVGTNDGRGIHEKIALRIVICMLLFVVCIVFMRNVKRLIETFVGSRRTKSGSTDLITTKLMLDAKMKVDKPAALGKAPETKATLDVTRDVGDTLRYT